MVKKSITLQQRQIVNDEIDILDFSGEIDINNNNRYSVYVIQEDKLNFYCDLSFLSVDTIYLSYPNKRPILMKKKEYCAFEYENMGVKLSCEIYLIDCHLDENEIKIRYDLCHKKEVLSKNELVIFIKK